MDLHRFDTSDWSLVRLRLQMELEDRIQEEEPQRLVPDISCTIDETLVQSITSDAEVYGGTSCAPPTSKYRPGQTAIFGSKNELSTDYLQSCQSTTMQYKYTSSARPSKQTLPIYTLTHSRLSLRNLPITSNTAPAIKLAPANIDMAR